MSGFSLKYEWLSAPEEGEAFGPDASTWGTFRVDIDGINVTANVIAERGSPSQVRPSVVGGLAGIADWLVENWLHVLWEIHTPFAKVVATDEATSRVPHLRDALDGFPRFVENSTLEHLARWQHRHSLGHGASDVALPSIVFLAEDRTVGISVEQPPLALEPDVRFERLGQDGRPWPREPVWVAKDQVEGELTRFVLDVIERATMQPSSKRWADWLRARFEASRASAADVATRRKYLLGEVVQREWAACEHQLGANINALETLLLDSELVTTVAELSRITNAVSAAVDAATPSKRDWRSFARPPGERLLPPYERGYRLATRARERLGKPKEPLLHLRAAFEQFGIGVEEVATRPIFRTAGVASENGGATILVAEPPTDGRPFGVSPMRFAMAAALGRLLAEGPLHSGAFGIGHGTQARWIRTQEANAFAAEFLLPKAALQEVGDDLDDLSENYGISRSAAKHHRENRLRNAS